MARTNKYTSINFNHILEKNLPPSSPSSTSSSTNNHKSSKPNQNPSSSFASYSSISSLNTNPNARTHGRMLVLTRPTLKPITATTPPLSPSPPPQSRKPTDRVSDQPPTDLNNQISLRPQGRTGAASVVPGPVRDSEPEKETAPSIGSPKPDRFVPPHLRPGFVPKGEKPGPEVFRVKETGVRQNQGYFGSPGLYGDGGRPKSGGNERIRKSGGLDLNRPGFGGNRPSSSGC